MWLLDLSGSSYLLKLLLHLDFRLWVAFYSVFPYTASSQQNNVSLLFISSVLLQIMREACADNPTQQ